MQCALNSTGTVQCWGDAQYFEGGENPYTGVDYTMPPTDSGYASISCGGTHCCVLDPAGYPTCWGGGFHPD